MKKTILVVILSLLLLNGCSYFKSSQRIDMAPFAENTISLVADISYGLNKGHAIHLRKYMHGEPIKEYQYHWERMRPVLRGIATYSLALVTISKSNMSEADKLDQLATFLNRMFRPIVEKPIHEMQMSAAELDVILADIRAQKNFLDGLRSAQPFVDEVARWTGDELDATKAAEETAEGWLMEQITLDYKDTLEFSDLLKKTQSRTFRSLILLRDFRSSGDEALIVALRENDPPLRVDLPKGNNLTLENIQDVEDRLAYRLSEIRKMKDQISDDMEEARGMVGELDTVVTAASNNLMRTRATIWVWSRAHARLAQGITDPAKVDMMGIAQKALMSALPF